MVKFGGMGGSPSSGSATLRLRLLGLSVHVNDKDEYNIISSVGSSVVGCTMIIAEKRLKAGEYVDGQEGRITV